MWTGLKPKSATGWKRSKLFIMEPNALSDNNLMMLVKGGDLDRLGLLFERYHRLLYSFFYRLNRNSALSQDLVQIVFERILKYKHQYRGEGEFKAWIFQIARNVNYDYARKKSNRPKESIESWQDQLLDQAPNQDAKMIKRENLAQLYQALDQLDPEKKEIIVMSKLQGLRYKKIAELMGITEGAVKVKVFRALKELKKIYKVG